MKTAVAKARISAKSRSIPKDAMLHYRAEVDSTWSDVATTRNREKVDKEARAEEMEMKRADNILKHEDEILSRPNVTQSTGRQIAATFGKMNFEKMLAGSQKRRPKQTQSDKIVNATYMKPSKPPQITTDKEWQEKKAEGKLLEVPDDLTDYSRSVKTS